jgi:hypothetical protein
MDDIDVGNSSDVGNSLSDKFQRRVSYLHYDLEAAPDREGGRGR